MFVTSHQPDAENVQILRKISQRSDTAARTTDARISRSIFPSISNIYTFKSRVDRSVFFIMVLYFYSMGYTI